jgi:Glyoxalase superfamily protein/S-adenosylmethionine synthetase, central domain
MRDFRDAKVMARALRDALKAKAIETTHAEALELIAKAFGYKNWNILSAKIEAAEPKPSDERWLSPSGAPVPPKRRMRTRDRHGERADPSQIARDYIAHPARLAVKDVGYQQRGVQWEKASIKVYLHGQSPDIAQGMVSTANKGAGNQAIMPGYADYTCRDTLELMPAPIYFAHRILKVISEVWHANPNGSFVIGELRHSWRGPLELRQCVRGELLAKIIVDT